MPFLTSLIVKADYGSQWALDQDLIYQTPHDGLITVPRSFLCDLASIPRIFQLLIPVNDTHRQAATLHDWLYYKKGVIGLHTYSREQCDKLFLQAMKETGVSAWKRFAMYFAVRVGGYIAWAT